YAGGIHLPAAAKVGHQRHKVAACIAAGEVVPGAGGGVDTKAARLAVAAYWIGRPVLHALAGAIRQPVGEQRVGLRQGGVGDALNLEVKGLHCSSSGASWIGRRAPLMHWRSDSRLRPLACSIVARLRKQAMATTSVGVLLARA